MLLENKTFRSTDFPIDERLFRLLINNRCTAIFAAVQDGTLLGYICIILGRKACHIYSFAVYEHHRGKGIGTALLEISEKYAIDSGARFIRLEVRCGNEAVRLYQRLGYSVKNIKKNYYNDGEDAFSMEKELGRNRRDGFEKVNIVGKRRPAAITVPATL